MASTTAHGPDGPDRWTLDHGQLQLNADEDIEPRCDYCGETWEDGGEGEDWNGETGCHISCEEVNREIDAMEARR